jgi:hypothetical protein
MIRLEVGAFGEVNSTTEGCGPISDSIGWVCDNCGRANCRFRWEAWVRLLILEVADVSNALNAIGYSHSSILTLLPFQLDHS